MQNLLIKINEYNGQQVTSSRNVSKRVEYFNNYS